MKGKVAVVTGANSGIGETISMKFASLGVKVTICGRDSQRLGLVFDRLVEMQGGDQTAFLIVQGDVNDAKVRKDIIDKTIEKFGRLDILVLNAGVSNWRQSVFNASEKTYDAIMDTNLKSAFFLTQQAIPHLERHQGIIITISSTVTYMINPPTMIYSISKSAIDYLTKQLAVALGPKGIRVNAVRCGYIATRIMRYMGDIMDKAQDIAVECEFREQLLKNRKVSSDDVAEAVAFLVSDAAALITGQFLNVDGGRQFSRNASPRFKNNL